MLVKLVPVTAFNVLLAGVKLHLVWQAQDGFWKLHTGAWNPQIWEWAKKALEAEIPPHMLTCCPRDRPPDSGRGQELPTHCTYRHLVLHVRGPHLLIPHHAWDGFRPAL